jgi:uncharacterized protein (DUF885 family)
MKLHFHRALLAACTLALAPAAFPADASGKTPTLHSPSGAAAAKQLAGVLAAADEVDLKLFPLTGLTRGDLRHADQYGDYITDDFLREHRSQLRFRLQQLRRIDRTRLSPMDKIAHDVFRHQNEYTLKAYGTGVAKINQALPLDHIFGAHMSFPQLSSGEGDAPFKTIADYENGLKRIDGFVVFLDRAIEKMRLGIKSGHVLIRVVTEKVVQQLDEAESAGVEKSAFLKPVQALPATFDDAQKRRLEAAYRTAISGQVLPALRRLNAFMKNEYLAASRTGAPGMAGMPDGAKLYAYVLEQHTTTTMSAAQIHRLGLSEVARIRGEMDKVRSKVGFAGSLAEFFVYLRTDARFQFKTKEELLAGFGKIHRRVDRELPKLFSSPPAAKFQIRPVPAEQESSAGGAYYLVGTPDGTRPGVFYVNTSELPTRTSPRMTALFLHEALPGHHWQGSLAQEDATLPALLRFGGNTAYLEGWGLYSEWLGEELGLFDDLYQYFGRLDLEIIRATRLVVDTGLHANGWTRDQAIQYMQDNSSLDRAAVEQEVDRYIVWPGQATAYKVGELFIKRLRKRAEQKLGAQFDVRAFHQQVLDTGAIPLSVLARKIDVWIAATGAKSH